MKKSRRWSLEPIKIRELASGFQAIKELAFGIHTDQGVGARHLEAYARHCRGKAASQFPYTRLLKFAVGCVHLCYKWYLRCTIQKVMANN